MGELMLIKKVIKADSLTPISIYLRLLGKNKVILESIPRDSSQSRYSIIAFNPVSHIKFQDGILHHDDEEIKTDDPFKNLENIVTAPKYDKESNLDFPFQSGAIGYVSFDMYGFYEDLQIDLSDNIDIPDFYFMIFESYFIYDHKEELVTIVEDNIYSGRTKEDLENQIKKDLAQLNKIASNEFEDNKLEKLSFTSMTEKKEFIESVAKARELIRQGDMFQIVLSQRFEADIRQNPFDYYRRLRVENPSSYLYYLDFEEFQIIGSSPERLVAVRDGIVSTNPIAGTRKRGANELEDIELAESLVRDPKEISEHQMLVDLGRNDIGKISDYGSVEVPLFMKVERYRFVMHLVSIVEGRLRKGLTSVDALLATLPAGTLCGAPKHRAYQRIYEFEKVKRGFYGGAVGYITHNDTCDFAITIRTMLVKNSKAYVQAGAGIVYDSDPQSEYQECLNKARLFMNLGD